MLGSLQPPIAPAAVLSYVPPWYLHTRVHTHLKYSKLIFFLFCLYVSFHRVCLVPVEVSREHQIHWSGTSR